jgi:hypothetical protein
LFFGNGVLCGCPIFHHDRHTEVSSTYWTFTEGFHVQEGTLRAGLPDGTCIFHTKNPALGKFLAPQNGKCLHILRLLGIFYGHFGTFYGRLVKFLVTWYTYFSVLVCFTKKNLATPVE